MSGSVSTASEGIGHDDVFLSCGVGGNDWISMMNGHGALPD